MESRVRWISLGVGIIDEVLESNNEDDVPVPMLVEPVPEPEPHEVISSMMERCLMMHEDVISACWRQALLNEEARLAMME